MKKTLIIALAVIFAVGLLFTGCDDDGNGTGNGPKPLGPHPGSNLVTEAAILAATGVGGTTVAKVSGGYEVTGTVTEWSNWDNSIEDNRITLNIPANILFNDAYYKSATRYIFEVNFPNSAVKPIPEYTEGFRIYLENTVATPNTAQWAGTWAREWPDEFNACGGVGAMAIDRDLRLDPMTAGSVSNVGDYQHLVIVLGFEDEDVGKEYKFTITKVEVWGDEVVMPGLASMTSFFSAEDLQSLCGTVTFTDGKVKAKTAKSWDDSIRVQVHFFNTGNIFKGGYYVSINVPDTALNITQFRAYAGDFALDDPNGWVSDKILNGANMKGDLTHYWDGKLWSGDPNKENDLHAIVLILVFDPGTAEGLDFEFTINQLLVGGSESVLGGW